MLSIMDSAVEGVGYRKMKDRKQQKKSQLGNMSDSVLVHPKPAELSILGITGPHSGYTHTAVTYIKYLLPDSANGNFSKCVNI